MSSRVNTVWTSPICDLRIINRTSGIAALVGLTSTYGPLCSSPLHLLCTASSSVVYPVRHWVYVSKECLNAQHLKSGSVHIEKPRDVTHWCQKTAWAFTHRWKSIKNIHLKFLNVLPQTDQTFIKTLCMLLFRCILTFEGSSVSAAGWSSESEAWRNCSTPEFM